MFNPKGRFKRSPLIQKTYVTWRVAEKKVFSSTQENCGEMNGRPFPMFLGNLEHGLKL
jgi:hypothetical protein